MQVATWIHYLKTFLEEWQILIIFLVWYFQAPIRSSPLRRVYINSPVFFCSWDLHLKLSWISSGLKTRGPQWIAVHQISRTSDEVSQRPKISGFFGRRSTKYNPSANMLEVSSNDNVGTYDQLMVNWWFGARSTYFLGKESMSHLGSQENHRHRLKSTFGGVMLVPRRLSSVGICLDLICIGINACYQKN